MCVRGTKRTCRLDWAMSAYRGRTEVNGAGQNGAIDPTETLASPDDNALETSFCPIKAFALAAKMPSPELGVGHAAPRFHDATRRRGYVAARCSGAAGCYWRENCEDRDTVGGRDD